MKNESRRGLLIFVITLGTLAAGTVFAGPISAQSPELQQKVADIKQAMAVNKQALAQYTWTEQDVISLKGDEKKEAGEDQHLKERASRDHAAEPPRRMIREGSMPLCR